MHKNTKAAFAAATAAVLLLGGAGTLASWNDSESIDGGAIKSGKLSLTVETDQGCTAWALDEAGGGGAFVAGTTLVVPGDVITRTCTYTVNAAGEHLAATVGLASPSFAETNDLVSALDATATYTRDPGTGAVPLASGAAITDANDGDVLSAAVSVTFDAATADTTAQEMTATLDALTVSLTQSHL